MKTGFFNNKIYVFKYQMTIYEAEFLGEPAPIRTTAKPKQPRKLRPWSLLRLS
jgi:hypothetical protein